MSLSVKGHEGQLGVVKNKINLWKYGAFKIVLEIIVMVCVHVSSLSIVTAASSRKNFTMWIGSTQSEYSSPFYVNPSGFSSSAWLKCTKASTKALSASRTLKFSPLFVTSNWVKRVFNQCFSNGLIYGMCPKSARTPCQSLLGLTPSSLAGHHVQGNHGWTLDPYRQNLSRRREFVNINHMTLDSRHSSWADHGNCHFCRWLLSKATGSCSTDFYNH